MLRRSKLVCVAIALIAPAASSFATDTIYVPALAPFERPDAVSEAIKAECDLPRKQVELLIKAAAKKGITVIQQPEGVTHDLKVLSLSIVRADSLGNAMGNYHAKSVAVRGKLMLNDQELGSFIGLRNSTGQALAPLKSSCDVLELCVKKLASDITKWLANPTMNARIGE